MKPATAKGAGGRGEALRCFWVFDKLQKNDYRSEVLDMFRMKWSFYEVFWRSSSRSTVPVQQRTPDDMSKIPGNGQGSLHICGKTLYAKDIFRENESLGKLDRSMKIFEIPWKSSEDKKPAWNRAKVFIRAAGPTFRNLSLQRCKITAAIASERRFNILSSRHRGLERSAAAVAWKLFKLYVLWNGRL